MTGVRRVIRLIRATRVGVAGSEPVDSRQGGSPNVGPPRRMRGIGGGEDRARFQFAMGCAENTVQTMTSSDHKRRGGEAQTREPVLLVDDEKPLLEVYEAALAPVFEITTASNAREADFILQKKSFKVVVADHLMPGGNGMNFLVRAREEFPHMQRVLVTGYMKPEMLLRSVNEAALFRYLLKPVSMGELLKVVQDAAKAHDASVAAGQ